MTEKEILDKVGIALDNFTPQPNSTITVTIDPERVSLEFAGQIMDIIRDEYPGKNIIMKTKGVDIK